MSVYIEWLYGEESKEFHKMIEEAVKQSLIIENITSSVEVSVMIVSSEEIKEINKEQRNIDQSTDVLSFPMLDYNPIDSMNATLNKCTRNPETNEVYLGDIVISWDKVIEQSQDYGHTVNRELSFLVIHSMLHLLGYDHMTEADERAMIKQQKLILDKLGIGR